MSTTLEEKAERYASPEEIRDHVRRHGGHSAVEKYGREYVLAAIVPLD